MKLYIFQDDRLVSYREAENVHRKPLREVAEHFAAGYRQVGWQNVTVEIESEERATIRLTRPFDRRTSFIEGRLEIYQEPQE